MTSASVLLGQGTKMELVLDGSGATNWTDVSSHLDATQAASVVRGRQRETDTFAPGTATFTLRNESRAFDPSNAAGAYYPYLVPRIRCRITLATNIIFYGFVDDIAVDYVLPSFSTTTFSCTDGLGLLASTLLQNLVVTDQLPGDRLGTILGDVNVNYTDPTNEVGLDITTLTMGAINSPFGVTADVSGNLYVVDSGNNRVVKYNVTTSAVSVVGSYAFSAPIGICWDPYSGDIYVTDTGNNHVIKWNGSSWANMASWGALSVPLGICTDPTNGEIFVADSGNSRVRQYNGGTPLTVGFTGLLNPYGVAHDGTQIFCCDNGNNRVVRRNAGVNYVTAWTGGGNAPVFIATTTPTGAFYVSDLLNVWQVDAGVQRKLPPLTTISTGLVVVNDIVYISDHTNDLVNAMWVWLSELGGNTLTQVSAMDHLNMVATSEYAYLYVDTTGTLQFRSRSPDFDAATSLLVGAPVPVCTFTDAGGGIKYQSIAMLSAGLLLFTQVSGITTASDAVTGARQYATSPNSSIYYMKVYQLPSVVLKNDVDVRALCRYVLSLYQNPEIRFDTLSVELENCSPTDQATLTSLELTDVVTVIRNPPGGGAAINIPQLIEGITYSLNAAQGTYTVTYSFGSIGA